jgi:hypothetical protein
MGELCTLIPETVEASAREGVAELACGANARRDARLDAARLDAARLDAARLDAARLDAARLNAARLYCGVRLHCGHVRNCIRYFIVCGGLLFREFRLLSAELRLQLGHPHFKSSLFRLLGALSHDDHLRKRSVTGTEPL